MKGRNFIFNPRKDRLGVPITGIRDSMRTLANAEDFAFDCDKEKEKFEFINCLSQTPRLNRGIWKSWETIIRKESQKTHQLIICGGIFQNKTIGAHVGVPSYCWKIDYNEDKNHALLHCLIF